MTGQRPDEGDFEAVRDEIEDHVRNLTYLDWWVEDTLISVTQWVADSLLNDGSAESERHLPHVERSAAPGRLPSGVICRERVEQAFFTDLRPSEFAELSGLLQRASEDVVYPARERLIEVFTSALVEFARLHPDARRVTAAVSDEDAP